LIIFFLALLTFYQKTAGCPVRVYGFRPEMQGLYLPLKSVIAALVFIIVFYFRRFHKNLAVPAVSLCLIFLIYSLYGMIASSRYIVNLTDAAGMLRLLFEAFIIYYIVFEGLKIPENFKFVKNK